MPSLCRIVIYTKKMQAMVDFYGAYFGYVPKYLEGDRIVELLPPSNGLTLLLHPAGKGQREAQALIKLVFDVEDVPAFRQICSDKGLEFGALHQGDGYQFANAKDPSGNSVSISSRGFVVGRDIT